MEVVGGGPSSEVLCSLFGGDEATVDSHERNEDERVDAVALGDGRDIPEDPILVVVSPNQNSVLSDFRMPVNHPTTKRRLELV